jgi:hypothetical protein
MAVFFSESAMGTPVVYALGVVGNYNSIFFAVNKKFIPSLLSSSYSIQECDQGKPL